MNAPNPEPDRKDIPLVLDVDGTLLKTDLLLETFWLALGRDLIKTLRVAASTWRRPAQMKRSLAKIACPQMELLPLRTTITDIMVAALREGRAVHLASGADQELVNALGEQLGLPGPHYGSTPARNLTDGAKATLLADQFGIGGYDYAGNGHADLKSWEGARRVIAVQPSAAITRRLAAMHKPVQIVPDGWGVRQVLAELRPHQWVKNALLFVPLMATHSFALGPLLAVVLAAVAFSIGASSIYILNDLLDLESDRSHPENRFRPIASGALPIGAGMRISVLLGLAAIGLALCVAPTVAGLTAFYMAGSLIYSLALKKRRWLDVLALAGLFLLRVLTGAAAAGVPIPTLLLAFAFASFVSLACVKRLTAITRLRRVDHLPGRGYSHHDLIPLERVAFASIPVGVVMFLAYVWGPHAASIYASPVLASLAVIPFAAWLIRMVRLSISGREDYDPTRFILHDWVGFILGIISLLLLALAA